MSLCRGCSSQCKTTPGKISLAGGLSSGYSPVVGVITDQ